MWQEKWFKADPRLQRHFEDHPEEKERFLKKSEVVELTKFARPILREAMEKDRHLEKILEEAKFLQANPKLRQRPRMEPVQGSNEFGYTSVERGHSPRIRW